MDLEIVLLLSASLVNPSPFDLLVTGLHNEGLISRQGSFAAVTSLYVTSILAELKREN